jgi:dTDP-4-dehydrorhamnose 3,5-epimerase
MHVRRTALEGVWEFHPTPHRDERGLFTRTFDAAIAAEHGVVFGPMSQDSQSRSLPGVLRGLHGRVGLGEGKLVRVAAGAVLDVVVDARRGSETFGRHIAVVLDDTDFTALYIPAGCLHGFQVLGDRAADVVYRIDRPHEEGEDVGVRYDDPELAIGWRPGTTLLSPRDASAGSWAEFVSSDHGARSSASSAPAS